jgi:hypothetical protein
MNSANSHYISAQPSKGREAFQAEINILVLVVNMIRGLFLRKTSSAQYDDNAKGKWGII